MSVEPETRAFLDWYHGLALPPLAGLSPAEARARQPYPGPPTVQVAQVDDRVVPGPDGGETPVRIYHPAPGTPLPTLVWLHGGGWVIGDLELSDEICRVLASRAGWAVVSVAYRLAPEHPFPAAVEDAHAVLAWVVGEGAVHGLDPARLAVGGSSAGGNLAAAAALVARDRRLPSLALQVLVYPATDFADTPSRRAFADGYLLTSDEMDWYARQYLARPEDAAHPYAAPLRCPDLSGLAPAFVVTAELDPLRDEGEAYAERLRAAGVPVTLRRFEGTVHGFVTFADRLAVGREATAEIVAALRAAAG